MSFLNQGNTNWKFIGIVILVIGVILFGLWRPWESRETAERLEVKGQLEIVSTFTPVFNKECLEIDLKVRDYYLTGICQKPHLVASLIEIIGEEIEIKGRVKEVKAAVPSEEEPEILVTKTFEVIEIEEFVPPEIIRIMTETTVYELEEVITVHLKHYLRKSIFSFFNTENPICSIRAIEKKNEDWQELITWSPPGDCHQVPLAEIKPLHLSEEFGRFDWQLDLEPGEYRLKILYKLDDEEAWQEAYSNEFIVLSPRMPTIDSLEDCKVQIGSNREAREKFQRLAGLKIKWSDYTDFFLEETNIQYGFNRFPIFGGPLTVKLIRSKDGQLLHSYRIPDPREWVVFCEICPPDIECLSCPPPEFKKEGNFIPSLTIPLIAYQATYPDGRIEVIDTSGADIIELYEREKLSEWAFSEGEVPPGFRPGELLIRIDLSECMKKFCDKVAFEDDPFCVGQYYSPPTKIKGRVTDPQGNPVERAMILVQWEPIGQPITWKSDTIATLYSDENGEFALDRFRERFTDESRVPEGDYSISIRPASWSTPNLKGTYKQFTLRAGDMKTINVILEQSGSVAGIITDKKGNPITDALVYEIGFETPRYAVCEESRARDGVCELGTFVIPAMNPGDYRIGALVRVGGSSIDISPKPVKVELGKTSIVNFVFEE